MSHGDSTDMKHRTHTNSGTVHASCKQAYGYTKQCKIIRGLRLAAPRGTVTPSNRGYHDKLEMIS
jgi:hypothetical protein